jgi:predicted membrane-bound dolichyl-phosphate-mannose-protein mannosyltransferase
MSRDSHPFLYALLGVWERFDTLWYMQISRHGYDSPAATVFYPLYPGLIRALSFITHSDLAAALLITTGASFFLFWGALRLFELDYSAGIALRAVLLWVVWPASFAFFAGYPDSLLCALTVWAIYFARSSRWLPAGTLGLLAGCTKAVGCFTALPLLWIAWKKRERGGLIAAVLCVAGVVCYEVCLAFNHFPSAAQVYRTYWATTTVGPWTSIGEAIRALAQSGDRLLLLNLGIFAVVGVAALMRPVRFEYKIYAFAAMCLFLTKHTQPLLQSTTRYSLTLFAAYPVLSARFNGLSFACLVLICAVLNLFLFLTFLDWGLVI